MLPLVFSGSIGPVFADHYSGQKWFGSTVEMCYDAFSMEVMVVDGDDDQFSIIEDVLDDARTDWNNEPSSFTLNRRNPDSFCTHWNTAAAFGSSGPLAITVRQVFGSTITDMDTEFNTSVDWSSSNHLCNPEPYDLQYVATHEYGHWVRFVDVDEGDPEDTIMWWDYDCDADSITSMDSDELSDIYG